MFKFERFIVYPLLIIALFYSMTGQKIMANAKQVYDEIVTKKISIVDDSGQTLLTMKKEKDEWGENIGVIIFNLESKLNGDFYNHKTRIEPGVLKTEILLNNKPTVSTILRAGNIKMLHFSNNGSSRKLDLGYRSIRFKDKEKTKNVYGYANTFGIGIYNSNDYNSNDKTFYEDSDLRYELSITENGIINSFLTAGNNKTIDISTGVGKGGIIRTYNQNGDIATNIGFGGSNYPGIYIFNKNGDIVGVYTFEGYLGETHY